MGDRVLTASVAGCGHCGGCATGDPVTCDDGPKVFGSGFLGGRQATAGLDPYPLPILMSLFRSVTLRMTTAPVHQTWAQLVPLVTSGSLRTDGIFTHRLPLASAAEAYAAVAARSPECIKVMMQP